MKLLTTKEAAERLHLHQKTVESYFRDGYIKAFKVGRNWRVPEEELGHFIRQNMFASRSGSRSNNPPAPLWKGEYAKPDDFVLRGATQLAQKERESFSVLTHTKLAEVWNHPDEVDYPLSVF